MENDEIFAGVRECLVDVLMLKDPGKVTAQSSLIMDLGADSLDFLDLIYQLEERFGIRISKEEINYFANMGLEETQIHHNGVLTERALERLRELMPEVSPGRLVSGLTLSDLPKLISVETLMNIVRKKTFSDTGRG